MKKSIDSLKLWDKNPREISDERLELLKKYLEKYGLLSPLKVTPDGEVLGGNHRLKAIKELGWTEVWVHEVKPKNDKEKLEMALIDNQEFASYIEDELRELVLDTPELELEDFSVTLDTTPLSMLVVSGDEFDSDFTLPDGEKSPFQQITFTLADQQADFIKDALKDAKDLSLETYNNENSNGNAIYWIVKQWVEQKT